MNHPADIVIFAASEPFADAAARIIKKRRLEHHVSVALATGEQALALAKEYARMGSRIFICRGRNTSLFQSHVSVPVIDVPFLYEEIYRSFEAVKAPPEKVTIIGFDKAWALLKTFRRISGLDVQIIAPKSPETVADELRQKLRPGTEVLIGGISVKRAVKECREMGLKHVPLLVDPSNISLAIDSALNILASMERKDEYLTTISATINRISNAVLNFDPSGNLLFSNDRGNALFPALRDLLFSGETAIYLKVGRRARADGFSVPRREQILRAGGKTYVAEYLPVIVNRKLKSIVVIVSSENSIQSAEKQLRLSQVSRGYTAKSHFGDIVGESRILKDTIRLAEKYARSHSSVLITGETGTGKELFAQSIHNKSSRADEPFVAINCAALPQSLLESELFGYVKGAFTGANREGKMGIFEMAHRGTVFLDEIGEMDLNVQAKLLRVLQEREVCRLGDDKIIPVDIRVISATNKDLEELVRQKLFREDLLYRLNVLELRLPPLRERAGDIPLLTDAYMGKQARPVSILPDAMDLLCRSAWPGNVRQLFNLLERIVTLADGEELAAGELAAILSPGIQPEREPGAMACGAALLESAVDGCEKARIGEALKRNRGNRGKTAKELGVSASTLWRKMKKYGISD